MADALVEELAAANNFHKHVSTYGRSWFAARLLAHVRKTGATNVKSEALRLLQKARAAAESLMQEMSKPADPALIFGRVDAQKWVQVVYGAMGVHPDVFLSGDAPGLLAFTAKRRYAAAMRMGKEVNPHFKYPTPDDPTKPDNDPLPHVNKAARDAQTWKPTGGTWPRAPSPPGAEYPFILNDEGRKTSLEAYVQLYESSEKHRDCTVLDCAAAAMTVHATALLEAAADRARLGNALVAEGERYLAIDLPFAPVSEDLPAGLPPLLTADAPAGDHVEVEAAFAWEVPRPLPATMALVGVDDVEEQVSIESLGKACSGNFTGTLTFEKLSRDYPAGSRLASRNGPTYHLTTDRRHEQSLFEQCFVSWEDLQIGDHVYLQNHPIHDMFLAGVSVWGGEHSFIWEAPAPRDRLKVTGHGIPPKSLKEVMEHLLRVTNVWVLDLLQQVVEEHVAGLGPDTLKFSGSLNNEKLNIEKVRDALRRLAGKSPGTAVSASCVVNESFIAPYGDRPIVPYQTLSLKSIAVGGQTIPDDSLLLLRFGHLKAEDWSTRFMELHRNDQLGPAQPVAMRWGVYYPDDEMGHPNDFLCLYRTPDEHRTEARVLGYEDVEGHALLGWDGKVFVTRPRVSDDPLYLAHLAAIGALASAR
jgi:hypothetical protein